MPTDPTFDATGLVVLRTEQIVENMIEALQASPAWGPDTQVQADQALAQLIQIPADQIGLVYELVQGLWDAFDPDAAPGAFLDNLLWILGITREPASRSWAWVDVTGDPNETIPAGSQARVPNGPFWYAPSDISLDGSGNGNGVLLSVDFGPIEAPAGQLTEVVSGSPPWSTVVNPGDAELGRLVESDIDARERRDLSLSRAGSATDHALRARLQALDSLTASTVISNRTLATVDGIPPKSFEPVIWPDTGYDVWDLARMIWEHTPNGISSHGTESATVTDDQGEQQKVKWSHATPVLIWWEIDVTANANYPGDGDDQVAAAVLAYAATLHVGDDVKPAGAVDAIFPEVPGVDHLVVKVKAGGAPGPGDTVPVAISARQISDHDSSRITVNS